MITEDMTAAGTMKSLHLEKSLQMEQLTSRLMNTPQLVESCQQRI